MKRFSLKFLLVFTLSSILVSCSSKSPDSTQATLGSSDTSQLNSVAESDPVAKIDDNPARLLYGSGLYMSNYNYVDAIPRLKQALQITQESGNVDMQLDALQMLGIGNLGNEQYDDAINYLEQHLALLKSEAKPDPIAPTLLFLGKAHHQKGNHDEALKQFKELEKLAEETGDLEDLQSIYISLGNVYGAMGDYKQAVAYAEKVLANPASLDSNDLADANALMGTALWKLKKLPESETHLKKAYAVFEQARIDDLASRELLPSVGVPRFFDLSDFKRLNVINREKHAVETFETSASTAALLQQVLIENNLPEKALEAAESGRARVTIDLLAKKLASNSSASEVSAQDPMATYCQQINQQADGFSPEQLQLIQQSINCDRYKKEDVAPSSTSSIKSLNIEEIKQVAKQQDVTIVEYSIIRDKSFGKFQGEEDKLLIWVVQPTGEVIFEEVDLKGRDSSIKDLTNNWHQGVASGSSDSKVLKELYKLLIDPIAKSLPKDKDAEVVFIPHESMFLVPFAALQNWWGKYLIQEHTISTSPAIEFLALASQKSQALQQANSTSEATLVVGNPGMPANLVSLPGAEQEAQDIAQILNIEPMIGNQATETSILEQISQSNRLHFATHAVIDHEDIKDLDIPGAIALTPDSSNDGWLTSSEIFDLELNADLVVLSACETARGDVRGDGVIGLSRSFISAGTPSVVASLWTIPDAPTATLMTTFYENLEEEGNKAQALRSAMLETMKEHKEPYNWAAFSLIGESD